MTIFYSPNTGAFYDDAFWDAPLPADATEVTPERHAELLEATTTGQIVQAGEDGQPVAVDAPAPPPETLAVLARRRRDAEIIAVRWMVDRHRDEQALDAPTTLSAEGYRTVLLHIQALRDVPAQSGFPADIAWPVLPTAIETQTSGEDQND
ncbi:phage tail assembly chaperone [Brevundimonas vesicularis]|uniref:Phage tail protein n=1 Tax=Brevundimonas vesicularis TaxID=41276 RepID=A0A1Z3U859_BREVE|nr:phage tail assembly chaperone [Brevundimonas vesicularis]ASE39340.1 phage tail protein [Brevundimonas vesicularis]